MSEWLKILVPGLVGLVVGLLLEPVKAQITLRIQLHNLRRALYGELSSFYSIADSAEQCVEGSRLKQKYLEDLKEFRFSTYQYARANPALFYALSESWSLDCLVREWESAAGKQIDSFPALALDLVGVGLVCEDLSEREFRKIEEAVFRCYLARKTKLQNDLSPCLCPRCMSELEVANRKGAKNSGEPNQNPS